VCRFLAIRIVPIQQGTMVTYPTTYFVSTGTGEPTAKRPTGSTRDQTRRRALLVMTIGLIEPGAIVDPRLVSLTVGISEGSREISTGQYYRI